MRTRQIGFIIIGISIMLLVVLISFVKDLQTSIRGQCGCEPGLCPMEHSLPIQSYLGISLVFIFIAIGIILVFTDKKIERLAIQKSERIQKMLKTLKEDEKKIYDLIENSDGAIFQSEIVEKIGISKVKVSRILDKLEGKGLIIRRRRGMSNVIILKHH